MRHLSTSPGRIRQGSVYNACTQAGKARHDQSIDPGGSTTPPIRCETRPDDPFQHLMNILEASVLSIVTWAFLLSFLIPVLLEAANGIKIVSQSNGQSMLRQQQNTACPHKNSHNGFHASPAKAINAQAFSDAQLSKRENVRTDSLISQATPDLQVTDVPSKNLDAYNSQAFADAETLNQLRSKLHASIPESPSKLPMSDSSGLVISAHTPQKKEAWFSCPSTKPDDAQPSIKEKISNLAGQKDSMKHHSFPSNAPFAVIWLPPKLVAVIVVGLLAAHLWSAFLLGEEPAAEDHHSKEDSVTAQAANPVARLPVAHFSCPVCFNENIPSEDGVQLEACGHSFCRTCLQRYLLHQVQQKSATMRGCMVPECRASISIQECGEMLRHHPLDLDRLQCWDIERSIPTDRLYHCPRPICSEMFEGEPHLAAKRPQQKCPHCQHEICLRCKSSWHQGGTCDQNPCDPATQQTLRGRPSAWLGKVPSMPVPG